MGGRCRLIANRGGFESLSAPGRAAAYLPRSGRRRASAFDERLLDHELAGLAVIAFDEILAEQQFPRVVHQRRTAADHHAILFSLERGQAGIAEQLAGMDQVGDPAAIAERVAGHGRIVDQLVAHPFADQFVPRQLRR